MSNEGCDIGLIGLGTMGRNFVLNMADHGFAVAVYNRTTEKTKDFMDNEVGARPIQAGYDLQEFIGLLSRPRALILLVAAGDPVDAVLRELCRCWRPAISSSTAATPISPTPTGAADSCPGNSLTLWAWGSPAGKPGPAMAPA